MGFEYVENRVAYLLSEFVIRAVEVIILEDDRPSSLLVPSVDRACDVVLLGRVQDHFSSGEHRRDLIESSWTLYESSMSESSDGYRAYFTYSYR